MFQVNMQRCFTYVFSKLYHFSFLIFRSFELKDIRLDEALRSFLEAFRLPGEAPVISLILEDFALRYFVSKFVTFCTKKECNGHSFFVPKTEN